VDPPHASGPGRIRSGTRLGPSLNISDRDPYARTPAGTAALCIPHSPHCTTEVYLEAGIFEILLHESLEPTPVARRTVIRSPIHQRFPNTVGWHFAPPTWPPPSLTENAITAAIASGGTECSKKSGGSEALLLSVAMTPSATASIRTPCGRVSTSSTRARCANAALLALYAAKPGVALRLGRAVTCTIAPEPSRVLCGAVACVGQSAGPTLTSNPCASYRLWRLRASVARVIAANVFAKIAGEPVSWKSRSTSGRAPDGSLASGTSR
jgi:hypothetical protein